jgi:signal transduction histidine kinase/ligand-binding sensor domain-containing protein
VTGLVVALGARQAVALEPGAPFNQYAHAEWPSLAHASAVRAVLPARGGLLWIGTSEGLVRFDGESMVPFDRQRLPGVVEGNIERLFEASDGALWVGSRAQGLSRLEGGSALSLRAADGLPGNLVRGFAETADGAIWVATFDGVARLPRGSRIPEVVSAGLPDPRVDAIAVDGVGNLWAGTRGGLARWDPGARRWRRELGPAPAPVRAQCLLAGPGGVFWVGTFGAGLWELRGGRWRAYTTADGLPSNEVAVLLADGQGRVWAATRNDGLAYRSGDRFQRFPLPALDGCDQSIETLAEDSEGGLWIGTEACGLHRLQDRPLRRLAHRDGLPADAVLGLAGHGRTVFVGTRGAGMALIHDDDGRAQPLGCERSLPCASCWDIAPLSEREFLVVCGTNDFLRWDGRSMTRAAVPPELPAASLALVASDGAVWMALGSTVVRWQRGVATRITAQEGLRGKRVLAEGARGTIWIAADDGVAAWRDGVVQVVRFATVAEAANVLEGRDGTLWIATKGMGLRVVRGGRAALVGVAQGLPTGWIVQPLEDDAGRLWASSAKGIFSVGGQDLAEVADGRRARVEADVYDGADGVLMRADAFGHPAGWKSADGRLWFATFGGVAVVDPRALRRAAPRVVLDEVWLGRDRLPATSRPAAAPRDLQVRFSARTFVPPETISFRYRLEGKDRDWIDAGSARAVRWTQLGPGRYRLVVQARQRDGGWTGPGAALAFGLAPPFYRTGWFAVVLAGTAALLLAAAHRLRLARARAALQAVIGERTRIARDIHDTLAQAFVATSVRLECVDQALDQADRATARVHLDAARRTVQASLDEARRSVWVLRPQGLERGLPAALQALVGAASGETLVELAVSGTPRPLPPTVEADLLRIAQEAVSNAYRHARAHRIRITLSYGRRAVSLAVSDDGAGLEEGGPTRGLAGMKERAAEIGGDLSIESQAGAGTTVRVEVAG